MPDPVVMAPDIASGGTRAGRSDRRAREGERDVGTAEAGGHPNAPRPLRSSSSGTKFAGSGRPTLSKVWSGVSGNVMPSSHCGNAPDSMASARSRRWKSGSLPLMNCASSHTGGVILTAPDVDLDGVHAVRDAVLEAGMVPLVVAPAGGTLGTGASALPAQRSYVTARSIEFDAVLVAGPPAVSGDTPGVRDGRGAPAARRPSTDPRVDQLLAEAFRHGKAIGAWAGGEAALAAAGVPADAPGVVVADSGTTALEQVRVLLAAHRVWERFTTRA